MVRLSLSLFRWKLGPTPLIQTTKYLEAEPLFLRNAVQVVLAHFNDAQPTSEGLKQFCIWSLPQIQYRNPNVQINVIKSVTPSPWVKFFLHDPITTLEQAVLVDCYGKSREQIHDHIKKILGKTPKMLKREAIQEATNPANFGYDCSRWCICEVEGQVPCPSQERIPRMKRWKFFMNPERIAEEEEEEATAQEEHMEWRKTRGYPTCTIRFFDCEHMDVYHPENKELYREKVEKFKKKM